MIISNLYLYDNLLLLNNFYSDFICVFEVSNLVSVLILILAGVSSLIGVIYMLQTGRQIIQQGTRGIAFGVGVQAGKAAYDKAKGGGSDNNTGDDKNKAEDNKDKDKPEEKAEKDDKEDKTDTDTYA
jgi:hypothetical protein